MQREDLRELRTASETAEVILDDKSADPYTAARCCLTGPEGEWQGMRIDLNATLPCRTRDDCGLARACINGKCSECTRVGKRGETIRGRFLESGCIWL